MKAYAMSLRLGILCLFCLACAPLASAVTVTRGPYLQMGTPTSLLVRWRTDVPTNSRVSFGTTAGSLTANADNATATTEHEVLVPGLTPNTRYFYSIGSTTTLQAGDNSYYFTTSPINGTTLPTRFWVLGDSGTANDNAPRRQRRLP